MTRPFPDRRAISVLEARDIVVTGRVQGVGFRPFVFQMAQRFGLRGSVRNGAGQVLVHVEGDREELGKFAAALIAEAPPLAQPRLHSSICAEVEDAQCFAILASDAPDLADVHVPPDLFCCDACLAELRTPSRRRYRYPFTNCTQCGPRYTLIRALPYDRPNTAMAGFPMCARCRAEYEDPRDRYFHAEPLACPECGPTLVFRRGGHADIHAELALNATVDRLRQGDIVAVKGVGGYHLMCDAANHAAVVRLRLRKNRPHKPLAVMFPQTGDDGLDAVRAHVLLDPAEARACLDPARPIVLATRRPASPLSAALAPNLSMLGVLLPYSPLHHLLLADFAGPLVATSGNISGEPVLTDEAEASRRLSGLADALLHHDRPIVRPADDSVVRVIRAVPRVLRSGRGMAPLEIELAREAPEPVLATGGHMKGAVALAWGRRAVISPHIGELDSRRSRAVFAQTIADLQELHQVRARRILCDANPSYAGARWARASGLPVTSVRHHVAHASALAGEYPEISRWLIFAWDGVGLGDDGAFWGGETFVGTAGDWRRVASLRSFDVLGGDRVGREPWRSAAALMWETGRAWRAPVAAADFAMQAWKKRKGTFTTSSAGRLLDAAAALVLGLQTATFEGQGPMMLESIAAPGSPALELPLTSDPKGVLRLDWAPLLPMVADETLSASTRSGILHESLAQSLAHQAMTLRRSHEFGAVGLTGGVFQNKRLCERTAALLEAEGIAVLQPALVPSNDGGLAFGQIIEFIHKKDAEAG